jgi:hypothetical protein
MVEKIMSPVAEAEHKLIEGVRELKLDTPLIRSFLEKTAKEYMRVFKKKGKVVALYPSEFIFEVHAKDWRKKVRVPIADFFAGKSNVAQRDLQLNYEGLMPHPVHSVLARPKKRNLRKGKTVGQYLKETKEQRS